MAALVVLGLIQQIYQVFNTIKSINDKVVGNKAQCETLTKRLLMLRPSLRTLQENNSVDEHCCETLRNFLAFVREIETFIGRFLKKGYFMKVFVRNTDAERFAEINEHLIDFVTILHFTVSIDDHQRRIQDQEDLQRDMEFFRLMFDEMKIQEKLTREQIVQLSADFKEQLDHKFQMLMEAMPIQHTQLRRVTDRDNSLQQSVQYLLAGHEHLPGGDVHSPLRTIPISEITYSRAESSVLGRGSFGIVYRAQLRHQTVALKAMNETGTPSPGLDLKELYKEARVMQLLSDQPFCLRFFGLAVYSHQDSSGKPVPFGMVLEIAKGSLWDALHNPHAVQLKQMLNLYKLPRKIWALLSVCSAFEFLHSVRITHRDIKTGNILVSGNGDLKVADFGLAKVCDVISEAESTASSNFGLKGTLQYMAFELVAPPPPTYRPIYNEQTDIYAFAVLANELLSEKKPYANIPPQALYANIIRGNGSLRPDLFSTESLLKDSNESMAASFTSLSGPCSLIGNGYIHELVLQVQEGWNSEPQRRPTFAAVRRRLELLQRVFSDQDVSDTSFNSAKTSSINSAHHDNKGNSHAHDSHDNAEGPTSLHQPSRCSKEAVTKLLSLWLVDKARMLLEHAEAGSTQLVQLGITSVDDLKDAVENDNSILVSKNMFTEYEAVKICRALGIDTQRSPVPKNTPPIRSNHRNFQAEENHVPVQSISPLFIEKSTTSDSSHVHQLALAFGGTNKKNKSSLNSSSSSATSTITSTGFPPNMKNEPKIPGNAKTTTDSSHAEKLSTTTGVVHGKSSQLDALGNNNVPPPAVKNIKIVSDGLLNEAKKNSFAEKLAHTLVRLPLTHSSIQPSAEACRTPVCDVRIIDTPLSLHNHGSHSTFLTSRVGHICGNLAVSDAVVIDMGSGYIKAGFAGDSEPKSWSYNVIAKPLDRKEKRRPGFWCNKESIVGEDNIAKIPEDVHFRTCSSINRGLPVNWDDMEAMYKFIFESELAVDPSERAIMLTEAMFLPADRERTAMLMFENFEVPALCICKQAPLVLFATGRTTGVVLNSGEGCTDASCVVDGYLLPHSVIRSIDHAGRDMTDFLHKYLCYQQGYTKLKNSYNGNFCDLETIKLGRMRVAENAKQFQLNVNLWDHADSNMYQLPDGTKVNGGGFHEILPGCRSELKDGGIYFDCIPCVEIPELLFQPLRMFLGPYYRDPSKDDCFSMPDCVYKSIMASEILEKKQFYSNVVLCGGNTLFKGFVERFAHDLAVKLPDASQHNLTVIAPPGQDRVSSVWKGGAIMASMSTFQQQWVTKKEYDEVGPSIMRSRL